MKIALITVAPPYRGGISKRSSILFQKLKQKHTVHLINYSRQYPSIFFPGKSQYIDNKECTIKSEQMIDTINPFNWFKVGSKLSSEKFDLIKFRFWHPFLCPALGTIARIIKKKSSQNPLHLLSVNCLLVPRQRVVDTT